MQRLLQVRLDCHGLPIATGRLAGAGHVDRVCLACIRWSVWLATVVLLAMRNI